MHSNHQLKLPSIQGAINYNTPCKGRAAGIKQEKEVLVSKLGLYKLVFFSSSLLLTEELTCLTLWVYEVIPFLFRVLIVLLSGFLPT